MERKKLIVSFSGGETSAFMAQWLWKHKQDEYEMIFVFANTGLENEETLRFVNHCSNHFGFDVVWVEAEVYYSERKSSGHKVVNFMTASRDGEPFEKVIRKYGIPNTSTPHCTRELKQNPIKSYARSIGWSDYYTAIGIRTDEADRISPNARQSKFLYPLINKDMIPTNKAVINLFWNGQPFRLQLKPYQGNCVTCWKKSDTKLFQIARENPNAFTWMQKMELRYGKFVPESRLKRMAERGITPLVPFNFFRGNRSVEQILNSAKSHNGLFSDDLVGGDSCEVFSECQS